MRPRVYRAYGLRVRSPWPLPCPEAPRAVRADLELVDGPPRLPSDRHGDRDRRAAGDDWFRYHRLPDGSDYLEWSGLFEFAVSPDGRRVTCHALGEVPPEVLHSYLLGQVLSFALIRRRLEPLHATAVVVDGAAVAFLGDCGYGKSTLGAAFVRAGHSLLTDDLLVLREGDAGFTASPGLPIIKLFPAIADRVLGEPARGIPMNAFTRKLVIPLAGPRGGVPRHAPLLRALYVLAPPPPGTPARGIRIRVLSPRRAFVELLRNTFNTMVLEPARLECQFRLATRIAAGLPVKALSFPRRLRDLPAVRQAILADLAA